MLLPTILFALAAFAQGTATVAPSAEPSTLASPEPGAATSPLPAESPTAAESPLPAATSLPTPAPHATPSVVYGYRFIPHLPKNPQPGQPLIYAVYLNAGTLRSGGPIDIKVNTTEDVVKVVSRGGSRAGTLSQVASGDFEANSKLPQIPLIAQGATIDLQFTASNADGKTFTVVVPVKLH
jgi:hypothetical protein